MQQSPHFRLLLVFLFLIAGPLAAQGSIKWEKDFDVALAKAKAENKIIFIAINMDGERANDEAVRLHYRHKTIVALSKNTINMFASIADHGSRCGRVPGITCKQHQKIEIRMREHFLKIPPGEDVTSPQHLFISPTGKILLSVVYQITVGELEWMFCESLKQLNPEFTAKLSGGARAPGRIKFGYERPKAPAEKPPTKEEVEEIIRQVRKGKIKFRDIADKVSIIIRSPDKEAIKFVESFVYSRWVRGDRRLQLIRAIGKTSPKEWFPVLEPFLENADRDTRLTTVIACERLAAPKSLKTLKKRWKKEHDPAIKGRILRAMAAAKPKDKGTCNTLVKVIKDDKIELLRINATLAAGIIEDRNMITKALALALADQSAKVRSTAAYVIAKRRDKELLAHLEEVLKRETDREAKKWLTAAQKTLAGKNTEAFKDFLTTVAGDAKEKELNGDRPDRRGGPGDFGGGRGGRRR